MMQRTPRNAVYYLFITIQYGAISITPVVAALTRLPTARVEAVGSAAPIAGSLLVFVQGQAWWIVIALYLAAGFSRAVCKYMGTPWFWAVLQSMLDELREHAFNAGADDPSHHHRVTLFRRVRWRLRIWPSRSRFWIWGPQRYPWSGWLVPVLRSGHTTQRTKSVFLAPDDADHAEGVAGQTWNCNSILYKHSLPDVDAESGKRNIKNYARESWVDSDSVNARIQRDGHVARCYCGIPVEVRNKLWGVIILDSRSPNGIKKPTTRNQVPYIIVAKFIGKLLERA